MTHKQRTHIARSMESQHAVDKCERTTCIHQIIISKFPASESLDKFTFSYQFIEPFVNKLLFALKTEKERRSHCKRIKI
jgi:hypothetical protein